MTTRRVLGLALSAVVATGPAAVAEETTRSFRTAVNAIENGDVAPQHALVISQRGEVLLERYWAGKDGWRGNREFGPDELHDLRSCSKSVVGLLVGIAIDEGKLPGVTTPAHTLFNDIPGERLADFSPEHRAITLEHLLLMRDGLDWDQTGNALMRKGRVNDERFMESFAPDPVTYVWSRPTARTAGAEFNYNSGATVLLAAAVEDAVGEDIEAYAGRTLFEPLGIESWEWMKDRNETPWAHFGLRLTPRDMLKIGQLVLNNGRWKDEQIVSESWIERMSDRRGGQRHYGYQWWLDTYTVEVDDVEVVAAGGLGGQFIRVIPSLGAVIVSTAGHYDDGKAAGASTGLVERAILPELRERVPTEKE